MGILTALTGTAAEQDFGSLQELVPGSFNENFRITDVIHKSNPLWH